MRCAHPECNGIHRWCVPMALMCPAARGMKRAYNRVWKLTTAKGIALRVRQHAKDRKTL